MCQSLRNKFRHGSSCSLCKGKELPVRLNNWTGSPVADPLLSVPLMYSTKAFPFLYADRGSDCGVGDCTKGLLLHWLSIRTSPLAEFKSQITTLSAYPQSYLCQISSSCSCSRAGRWHKETANKCTQGRGEHKHPPGRAQPEERAGLSWTEVSRLLEKEVSESYSSKQSLPCICSLSFSVQAQVTFLNSEFSLQETETSDTTNYNYK